MPELGETALGVRRDFERVAPGGRGDLRVGRAGRCLLRAARGRGAAARHARRRRLATRRAARSGRFRSARPIRCWDARAGARAVAATDARLLRLDRATFRSMCFERPDIAVQVMERLARRSADLERRLAALGMNDLVRPVARGLLRCGGGGGGPADSAHDDVAARARGGRGPLAARDRIAVCRNSSTASSCGSSTTRFGSPIAARSRPACRRAARPTRPTPAWLPDRSLVDPFGTRAVAWSRSDRGAEPFETEGRALARRGAVLCTSSCCSRRRCSAEPRWRSPWT